MLSGDEGRDGMRRDGPGEDGWDQLNEGWDHVARDE
jgi:hypothetical protein